MKSFGQIAYEAYYESVAGKSLVSGESLPAWDEQSPRIMAAWDAAGQAVSRAVNGAGQ